MIDGTTFSLLAGVCFAAVLAAAWLRPAWMVTHSDRVLGIVAVVTLAAVASIIQLDPPGLRIALDPSSEPLIPLGDPGQSSYRNATLNFGTDDVYVIAVETQDVFTHENLKMLERISGRVRRIPGVRGAESVVDVLSFRYVPEGDYVRIGRFIEEVPEDAASLAALRRTALDDDLYRKTIISEDGRTAAINVSFRPMTDGEFLGRDLDGQIRRVLEDEVGGGNRFFVSGRPHIRAEAHSLMVRDLLRLVPLSALLAAIVVYLLTGSVRGVLVPLAGSLIATVWTFGAMALLGRDINVITLALAPTLICVGSVYGVHVMARFETIAAREPNAPTASLHCLEYSRTPVMMAGFTTCMGFGALLLTDIPATWEMGAFSIFGVAAVTVLSLSFAPAVLARLPVEESQEAGQPLYERRTRASAFFGRGIERALARMGRLTVRHASACLVAWGLLTVAAVALIPRIVVDTDFLRFFDERSRVRQDFAAVNRLLAGTIPLYVTLEGTDEGTFREPEVLLAVERLQRRIAAIPGVSQVLSAVDLIRVGNRAVGGGTDEADRIPDSRPGVAEVVFMIPKAKLRRFATSNHSKANLVVRTGRLGSAAMRALEERIRAAIAETGLPDGIRADVVGNATLLSHSADRIAGNQVTQVGFAALAILVLVCVVFRSISVGLISMIPNIVPVVIYFGVLGLGFTTLSLPTSLIGCIALGIAIDDTIHFLVAYRQRRREGHPPEEAVPYVIRSVGRPIVITSFTLVIGFLAMLLSGFATLREFGYLTALTMGICLTTDLILLPALLVRARA
ncbi:MAG: RND family transporter [Deltaproteobacteria bacterium]|nr:RND family transporter [Deltaproteobacteria bacterium]